MKEGEPGVCRLQKVRRFQQGGVPSPPRCGWCRGLNGEPPKRQLYPNPQIWGFVQFALYRLPYRANDGMKNLKKFFSGISGWALHPIPFSLMSEAESIERHT